MSTIDRSGNIHKGAGAPGAGRFDGRVNVAPTGTLVENGSIEMQIGRLTAHLSGNHGYYSEETARSIAEHQIIEATESGCDPAFAADVIIRFSLDAREHLSPSDLWAAGYRTPADIADVMEAVEKMSRGRALREGLTVGRLAELRELGIRNATVAVVLHRVEDDTLAEWVSAVQGDAEFSKWLGPDPQNLLALIDSGVEPALARRWADVGVSSAKLGAVGRSALPNAESVADFARSSGLNGDLALDYVRSGVPVDPELARAFGPSISPADAATLVSNGVSAKAARSLRSASSTLTPVDIAELAKGGVTTAADFRVWRSVCEPKPGGLYGTGSDMNPLSTGNMIRDIVAVRARTSAPASAVIEYVRRGAKDPRAWEALYGAGITDLQPWLAPIRDGRRVNIDGDPQAAIEGLAAWVSAGGSPERLRAAQRAGIPITQAHEHVNDDDRTMWAVGEVHRTAAVGRAVAAGSREDQSAAWEWTQDTFAM
ncbi:hypothetical protein [Microbacterium gorillae]|uniref:hypothetical protein n=1 Tax=Microbacterium gorillae TaxID=1231063 RepID=UPI003D98061A